LLLQEPDAALTVSSIMVTAAPKANMPPLAATLEFIVIEVYAMTVPQKVVLVPNVAELPTCQKTLLA